MEENKEILPKNKIKKIAIIILIVCIAIFLKNFLWTIKADMGKISEYQKEINEYLQEKYEEDFNIKFLKSGYKKKSFSIDGATAYYGRDRNILEYVYTYSPKNNSNIICYIAYWYEIDTGNSEISEIRDGSEISVASYKVVPYWAYLTNATIMEVKEILKSYLDDEYIIECDFNLEERKFPARNTQIIDAKTSKKIKDIIVDDSYKFTDLSNKLLRLAIDKGVIITLWHEDYNIRWFSKNEISVFNATGKLKVESFDNVNEMILYLKSLQ